ncbi:hypothetical protein AB0I49_13485 [Streptomyces sp. NPDC050617]|uniref:hypothetical protein n=1 Tax=Streptomyces sp. NPDC050617 TaxID=3154628 RepID=UPI00341D09E3
MRWLTLYARSRQAPASLAATLVAAVVVRALGRGGGAGDPQFAALALTAGVTAASVGLGGQDLALDRTAAIRWAPRRAAHVLLAGAAVAAVVLAVQTLGDDLAGTAFLVRDGVGLMGLAAIGAAVCGGQYAWTPPVTWVAVALLAPAGSASAPMRVTTWILQPPGTAAAMWTSLVLAVGGAVVYAFAGPRR